MCNIEIPNEISQYIECTCENNTNAIKCVKYTTVHTRIVTL